MTSGTPSYTPARSCDVEHLVVRGNVRYLLRRWRPAAPQALDAPVLLLAHGWMDVGASFQFCVDGLAAGREVVALDWRGFGGSHCAEPVDSYGFTDYYGDLDAIVDHLSPARPIDLLGHSMGGNIVMTYAGARPARVRRLVNVEGFGLPNAAPARAPARLAQWLDELRQPQAMRTFGGPGDVAAYLRKKNPRMRTGHAEWLARHWAQPGVDGRWHVLGDPAHKRVNPILYRAEEALAAWAAIEAPLLWVEGDATDQERWAGDRYPRVEFEARLAKVETLSRAMIGDSGHMIHLEQPLALAAALEDFLRR